VEGNLVRRAPVNLRLGFGNCGKYRDCPFLCPFADTRSFNDAADLLPGIVRVFVTMFMMMLMFMVVFMMMFVTVFMVMFMFVFVVMFMFMMMFVFMVMFVLIIAGYMIGTAFNIHYRVEAGDAVTLILFKPELPAFQSQLPQFRRQGLPIHTEIDKGSQAHIPRDPRKTVKMQRFHFSNP
jgi:hypothetical protein